MNNIEKFDSNKIRYLDGTRLKNAVLASIGHLEQHHDYLNQINVVTIQPSMCQG
jgi:hypothetical protein